MLANPEKLFERSWRPRHPLRRRHCAARRRGMLAIFLFLSIVILGYIYLTDSQRVQEMASTYLSDLLGGEVTIGKANLSIFEGLRLDDVTLEVDNARKPDSIVFHARTLLLRYHPAELLAGKLSATQIVAIDPVVMLVEDPVAHRWNYQRLWHGAGPPKRKNQNGQGALVLPQIILRDAQVAYMELQGGKTVTVGSYSIEGSLNPSEEEPDRYDFQLQSRGREAMGPSVDGVLRTEGGISEAHLQNFTFGPDVKTMLLAEPRQWCEWHQLQGRIDVPEMMFNPNPGGGGPLFNAELVLSDVEMVVHPEEWQSREQNHRVAFFHTLVDKAEARRWISPALAEALRRLSAPQPVRFTEVSGNLLFTDRGIQLKGLSGKMENNWFNIDGQIDGYSPDAPARLTISSATGHDLEMPDVPPEYLGTLPHELQDVIEHLHPNGRCSFELNIVRPEAGGKPDVTGRMDIKDGNFCFAGFPYPISGVRGEMVLGPDPIAHMRGVRLLNVQGFGLPDGPNANSTITINGFVGPLEGVAGVEMQVEANDMEGDAPVRAALPPEARRALKLFDADGHGDLPRFHGGFSCHVFRLPGPNKPWKVDINARLDDAEGKLASFPYPLKHFTGKLDIHDGYLNLVDGQMRHGDGVVSVNGSVRWWTNTSRVGPFGPNLRITMKNVPIDDDLIQALPPVQRAWAQQGGLSGRLDMDGLVFPGKNADKVDYSFNGTLRDGAVQSSGEAAMSGMTASLHIVPSQLEITDLTGRRGASEVSAHAVVDWSGSPRVMLSAAAKNLELNQSLYRMLPSSARKAWDSVQPHGNVDGTLELADAIGSPPERLELHIVPRGLSVTPAPLPYRLDNLSGDILISPDDVVLKNLTATHGAASITVSGQGKLRGQQAWELKIAAAGLNVDDDLLSALPKSISDVVLGLKAKGPVAVDLSKLSYWPNGANTDVDFAAKVTLEGGSLEVGLPATDVHGSVDLAGLVRDGKLSRLAGQCTADSFLLAGRPASDFKLTLAKTSADPEIDITKVEGKFADGDIEGDGDYIFPDSGQSKYDVNIRLRDADFQQIASSNQKGLKGRLTASLQLGGAWDDPSSRRGHGDVSVVGEHMYDIPVMLGLMQITNLALPLGSSFNQVETRYTLEGQKVIFERIRLISPDMSMDGSGELDFAARRVSLWLTTNNPTLLQIPILGPLIAGANQELLRIHIKGTIDQPKVSASTFDTVTTTVDQVLKGNDQENQ